MATRSNPHWDPFKRDNQQNWDKINKWTVEENRIWDSFQVRDYWLINSNRSEVKRFIKNKQNKDKFFDYFF